MILAQKSGRGKFPFIVGGAPHTLAHNKVSGMAGTFVVLLSSQRYTMSTNYIAGIDQTLYA